MPVAPELQYLELDINKITDRIGFTSPSFCATQFDSWLNKLQSAYGKENAFRAIPALQRGIDKVYSHLEKTKYKLHTERSTAYDYGVAAVTEHPIWVVLVGSVSRHFPDIVKVVRPSRTPQESIRAKCINRTFFNFIVQKQRLLESFKSDMIAEGELGRIQIQILEAQIASLKKTYSERSQIDEKVWQVLNSYRNRSEIFHSKKEVKGRINKKNGSLVIDETAELFAEMKVEISKTWDFANILQNKLSASASLACRAKASGNLSANFGHNGGARVDFDKPDSLNSAVSHKDTNFTKDEITNRNGFATMQLIPGIDLGVKAELAAMIGAKVTVKHELTVGQIMEMTNEAELFVGAEVKAFAHGNINSSNIFGADEVIVGKLGVSAFAGLKAKGSGSVTFKARGIDAAAIKASGEVSAGIGIKAEIESVVRGSGDIKFRIATGATVGVGSAVDVDTMVNPMVLKVILWDGFAHHFTTSHYQERLNKRLDRDLNGVAVIRCRELVNMTLIIIEQDYKKLAEELWRIPADANYSNGTIHDYIGRGQNLNDAYMSSVHANDIEGLEQDSLGLMRSSAVLHHSASEYKSKQKSQTKGRKFKRKLKGLLVLKPIHYHA